tara:strand:- start:247 stop:1452 length:1206 start_codon:yes stop_codon:yes gene_type:complete
MKKNLKNYLGIYLITLLFFSYFFLFVKHQVGNDSTISEWFINYEGGFTKRGLIGQIAIEMARFFETNLRWMIFLLQSFICSIYFFLLYQFLKNLKFERITILSIFTPIFILYPVAEIEVLARKEIIIFVGFLIYLFIPRQSNFKFISFILFTVLGILIWEPLIFFFPIILILELIENNIKRINLGFFKIILGFIPSLIIASIIIFNPLSAEEHKIMSSVLSNEFNERCYMSCELLKSKSTIAQQFEAQFGKYSFEVLLRYFLIIFIGFYPLFALLNNSVLINKNLLFFRFFKKPINLIYLSLLPVIVLFAMGYDWGRWVNVTYVILILTYFHLFSKKYLKLNYKKLSSNIIYKIKGKLFIIFFILFCFGWNPKTVMLGDVASFPGYRIPVKIINKIFTGEY